MSRRALLLPGVVLFASGIVYGPELWRRLYQPVKEYCEMYLTSGWAVASPALAVIAIAAAAGAVARLIVQVKSDAALVRRIRERTVATPPALARAAAAACLRPPVICIDDDAPLAFCRGFARPRVHVSTGLVQLLNERELIVVLVHEGAHAAGLHPLRAFAVRLLAGSTYLLPIAKAAEERYLLSLEFTADRRAADVSLPHLASALLKLLEARPADGPFAGAGLAFNPTEERIRRLTEGQGAVGGRRWLSPLTRPFAWSAASSMLVVSVIGLSVPVVNSIRSCSPPMAG